MVNVQLLPALEVNINGDMTPLRWSANIPSEFNLRKEVVELHNFTEFEGKRFIYETLPIGSFTSNI